jgi:hypothetical protein
VEIRLQWPMLITHREKIPKYLEKKSSLIMPLEFLYISIG